MWWKTAISSSLQPNVWLKGVKITSWTNEKIFSAQSDFLDFYVSYLKELPDCLSVVTMLASSSMKSAAFVDVRLRKKTKQFQTPSSASIVIELCKTLTCFPLDLVGRFLPLPAWRSGGWIQTFALHPAPPASPEDPRIPAAVTGGIYNVSSF